MSVIKMTFEANTPEELRKVLADFANALGTPDAVASSHFPTDTKAELDVDTAPKTTKKKTTAKKKAEEPKAEEPKAEEPKAEEPKADEPAAEEPKAEGNDNVVSDLTPTEARDKAIKTMQSHFAKNPNSMPEISKLQQKYGIKMFSEIADDKARDLLADVLLIVSGTGSE